MSLGWGQSGRQRRPERYGTGLSPRQNVLELGFHGVMPPGASAARAWWEGQRTISTARR